ncbi:MAG: PilZ domain-containing protein [Sphingomonas sp.]
MQRMHGWVGRKDRHAVAIEAVVHWDDGRTRSVKLSNFSKEGCRIESDIDFRIGERLEIDVPRFGQVKAQVRWAFAGSAGAKFLAGSEVEQR